MHKYINYFSFNTSNSIVVIADSHIKKHRSKDLTIYVTVVLCLANLKFDLLSASNTGWPHSHASMLIKTVNKT